MNSLKTTIVCVVLLGVLYGMYQVINTPEPSFDEDEPLVGFTGDPIDPGELNLDSGTFDSPPASKSSAPELGSSGGQSSNSELLSGNPTNELSPRSRNSSGANTDLQMPGRNPIQRAGATEPLQPTGESGSPLGGYHLSDDTINGTADNASPNNSTAGGVSDSNGSNRGTPIPAHDIGEELAKAWETVDDLISRHRYSEALQELSKFHGQPALSPAQDEELTNWLNHLAAKVIYSMEHHLIFPYTVVSGDSIDRLAKQNGVPVELLKNINSRRLDANGEVISGTELKMVPGPFHATINLRRSELVLWLDEMYAGSFPIRLSNDPRLQPGKILTVIQRSANGITFLTSQGSSIPAGDPRNPYGNHVLELGEGVILHGLAAGQSASIPPGSIGCATPAAKDLYEILSRESEIRIVK